MVFVEPFPVAPALSCAGCGCAISNGMNHWCAPAWARTTSAPIYSISNSTTFRWWTTPGTASSV